MNALWNRLNPAVPRGVLVPLAMVTWGGVGVMLMTRAGIWLSAMTTGTALISVGVGLLMAGLMIPGMFLRLTNKNLLRLSVRPERTCVFSVFAWRSWGIALVMSVLGVTLRNSDLSRVYLAGPYLGMGLCLFSGAIRYGQAWRTRAD